MFRSRSLIWNALDSSADALDYIPKQRSKRIVSKRSKTLYDFLQPSANDEEFYLGDLILGTTNNEMPMEYDKNEVEFSNDPDDNSQTVIVLTLGSYNVIIKSLWNKQFLKDLFTSKLFALTFYQNHSQEVLARLFLTQLSFSKSNKRWFGSFIRRLFGLIFTHLEEPIQEQQISDGMLTAADLKKFFCDVKQYKDKNFFRLVDFNKKLMPQFIPSLRQYQAQAVNWMINREMQCMENFKRGTELDPLYTELILPSGKVIYVNKHSGEISLDKMFIDATSESCGILADEMGLGKTVEMLACILLHRNNSTLVDYCASSSSLSIESNIHMVEPPAKKIKLLDKDSEVATNKTSKIPPEWVKRKPRSEIRMCLENWYEGVLKGFAASSKLNSYDVKHTESLVKCQCGNAHVTSTVKCVDCKLLQHAECQGYHSSQLGPYRCNDCWTKIPPIDTKATLIVCPLALRVQWLSEIKKHIQGDFKVLDYRGCRETGIIYPTSLLDYDLVLCTYNTMQVELRLVDLPEEKTFRHRKKYPPYCSPLVRVRWWRLCVDEAQMVESPTTKVSEMMRRLEAQLRWAVTGTPISNNISDLYRLIDYLQLSPYNKPEAWKHVLLLPYLRGDTEPLCKFLATVFWRNSKDEVYDQLNIPPQTVEECAVNFSAIEEYFYKRVHREKLEEFRTKIRHVDHSTLLGSLQKDVLRAIFNPLIALRQACTFPNTVNIKYLTSRKPVSSMKDLLDAMIDKHNQENMERLREAIGALNGMAGVYLLQQKPVEAISSYHQVLQLYTRFKEEEEIKVPVDQLQIIHTMHNLAEVLEFNTARDAPDTLRDATLRDDCRLIEKQYHSKFAKETLNALKQYTNEKQNVEKYQENFLLGPGQWYAQFVPWVINRNHLNALLNRIASTHDQHGVKYKDNYEQVSILYVICTWDDKLSAYRNDALDTVHGLFTLNNNEGEEDITIDNTLVAHASQCHLRPVKRSSKKKKNRIIPCAICAANAALQEYELVLFSLEKKATSSEDSTLIGSWKPSSEELIVRALYGLAKYLKADKNIISDAEQHINLIDGLKREFKELRKLWLFISQQVAALDEVDICKTRLRIKESTSEDTKPPQELRRLLNTLEITISSNLETINLLDEHALEHHEVDLKAQFENSSDNLEKNLATQRYLNTLRKQQYEGVKPDPCPICHNELINHWAITPCGHTYCLECLQKLINRFGNSIRTSHIDCSVCRIRCKIIDISYVNPKYINCSSENEPDINGNYSIKIEAIIRLIFRLKTEDMNVKILVFSSWALTLKVLMKAFQKNNISCATFFSSNSNKDLAKFKNGSENITALLIPIHLGSKGLNLTEATHVILVEPVLNPSDELQAIGRVHRIGQTRPTVVHKFYVKSTIEENILNSIHANDEGWHRSKVTIGQLVDLFIDDENKSTQSENSSDVVTLPDAHTNATT